MAEQDIKENEMTVSSSVDYVRGLKGKDSVLITVEDLKQQIGLYRINKSIPAGGQIELPFINGLIMIQDASFYVKSVATLLSNNSGSVIVPSNSINFFSEVENKICVMNTGNNTKYIVKNTNTINKDIVITFIN